MPAPSGRCASGHCARNLGRIPPGIPVLVTTHGIVWCRLAFLVENLPCFIHSNIFMACVLLRRNSMLANNYFFQTNVHEGNCWKHLCCFCLECSCVLVRIQKPLPSNWLLMALLFQSPAWSWFLFSVGSWSSVAAKKRKSLSSRKKGSCLLSAGAVPCRGFCKQTVPWCCNLAQFPARERKFCGLIWRILNFETEHGCKKIPVAAMSSAGNSGHIVQDSQIPSVPVTWKFLLFSSCKHSSNTFCTTFFWPKRITCVGITDREMSSFFLKKQNNKKQHYHQRQGFGEGLGSAAAAFERAGWLVQLHDL